MKKISISFGVALLAIILGLTLYSPIQKYLAKGKVFAAGSSYTLKQHEENSLAGRPTRTLRIITVAQRGDGARSVTTAVPSLTYSDREIYLPVEGLHKTATDSVQVVSTYKMDPNQYLAHLGAIYDSSKGCAVPYSGTPIDGAPKIVGTKTISNIATNQIQTTNNISKWLAPGMNCEQLENEWHFDDGSITKLVVDSLTFAEPDASLFTVDPSYTEVRPSEALRRKLTKANAPQSVIDRLPQTAARQDAVYQATKQ